MKHYAVALVWAWLAEHPEYYSSWVSSHSQMRWSAAERRMVVTRVGGHWRRLANWGGIMPNVGRVCKFERLVRPVLMEPKPEVGTGGGWVPRRYRVNVFI